MAKTGKILTIVALAAAGSVTFAYAQSGSAYERARAAGDIGERTDGYIGIVGASTPALKAVVDDINIKRKAVYTQKAQAQRATVEEYAFTSGCLLIQKTRPGEKYQTPNGSWAVRGAAPPQRDSRCP